MRPLPLLLLACAALGGCIPIHPGPHGDYDIGFARSYVRADTRAAPQTLSVPQLYAAHRYLQNTTHPSQSLTSEFVRRGAATAPFLRAQLEAPRSFPQLASVLELLRAMQDARTFDARSDPTLIAAMQRAAQAHDNSSTLRDLADEIETGQRFPTRWPPAGRRLLQGLGDDYDSRFARDYCRGCDYLDWVSRLDSLTIEQLYAVQRFGWEARAFPRDIDLYVARRGVAAIPFLKARLVDGGTGFMVWNILSVLQRMQHERHYDVLGDAELMRLAESAVARVDGDWSGYVRRSLEDLRQGRLSVW